MSINWAIYQDLELLKKAVTERFLLATYEIYSNHPEYTYSDSESETKIQLFPSYADVKMPGKKPKIIFKTGGYAFSLTDTFNQNMYGAVKNEQGIYAGTSHIKRMNTSVTALVQAYTEEQSSDIADEFALLSTFAAKEVFAQVGLDIQAVQVSETDLRDAELNLFQTVISISVGYYWETKVTKGDGPVHNIEFETELEHRIHPKDQTPGVRVFRERIKGILPQTDKNST